MWTGNENTNPGVGEHSKGRGVRRAPAPNDMPPTENPDDDRDDEISDDDEDQDQESR